MRRCLLALAAPCGYPVTMLRWAACGLFAAVAACGADDGASGVVLDPVPSPSPTSTGDPAVGTGGGTPTATSPSLNPPPPASTAPTPTPQPVADCDYPGLAGALYDQRIDVGGESRSYYIHVPPTYDPCTPAPMLLFFHGTDRDLEPVANQDHYVRYTRLPESADANGYILVIPSGLPADGTYFGRALVWSWSEFGISDRNEAFALALTDSLPTQYHVDPQRIYFAGFSSGAHFAVRLLARHGHRYAGVGVFAGSLSGQDLSAAPRIPTFLIVGTDDSSYVDRMRTLRDTFLGLGWLEGDNLYYEEVVGLPHEYPTPRFAGSRNQEMWDFLSR